jgi:hypothetical protein
MLTIASQPFFIQNIAGKSCKGKEGNQWNSAFFAISFIIEGTTAKVLQFKMPLKSTYSRKFGFIEQKMYFEHYREFQARKTLLIDIIFAMKKEYLLTFLELPPYAYVSTTQICTVPLRERDGEVINCALRGREIILASQLILPRVSFQGA